jgi:hypothetical protein
MGYVGVKPSAVPLTSADITDGIITSAKIVDGTIVNADINASAAIVNSKLSGVGIIEADVFRLTTNFTGNAEPIASNWERVDNASASLLGTGMTQSSGVFTFPSTGYYYVLFVHLFYHTADDRAVSNYISVTTNNGSTYEDVSEGFSHINNISGTVVAGSGFASAIIDVTSTANVKVRFNVIKQTAGVTTYGSSTTSRTYSTFIRLGDT